MKTLVICRHAKSDWELGLADFDRPLNVRGKKDAPRMGKHLASLGFKADAILSSPAVRAQTTARIVAKEMGYEGTVRLEAGLYDSGYGQALGILQGISNTVDTLMVFGHNPTLEQLAQFLLQSQGEIILPTSGMIAIEFPLTEWKDLGTKAGSLKWLLIPKMLFE